MFLNNHYSKSSPEKTECLNIKHKQVQHVLEYFETFHECEILMQFLGKKLIKWVKTFIDNQIEPCENDGDLRIRIWYCYLRQNRQAFYQFSWAFILDDDCMNDWTNAFVCI